jgi:hypothetical protein
VDEPEHDEDTDIDDGDGAAGAAPAATPGTRDLADGESTTMRGSAAQPYVLKNAGQLHE